MGDRIIRLVDLAPDERERLPIYSEPLDAVRVPDWLAVVEERSDRAPRFILNWVLADGTVIDFAIRHSLDEALDEVQEVVERSAWQSCDIELGDYDDMFRFELPPRAAIG